MAEQLITLFVLALPIASIAWTVTHEEIFRELHQRCVANSQSCRSLVARKFFYALSCEFCLSHYVTVLMLIMTRYRLLWPDWRGYIVAGFSLVWIANIYMSVYGRLRLDIKHERVDIAADEKALEESNERARLSPPSTRPREVRAGSRH